MATAPRQQKIATKIHDSGMLNIWTEEAARIRRATSTSAKTSPEKNFLMNTC